MYKFMFIWTTLLQLIVLNRYFAVLFHKPDRGLKTVAVHYAATGCILYVSTVSFFPPSVTGLLSVCGALLIALLYPAQPGSKLIYAALYLVLGFVAESLAYYGISVFYKLGLNEDLHLPENRLILLLISSLIMMLFILLIRFIKRSRDYRIHGMYYPAMALIILISMLLLNTLFFYSEKNPFYLMSLLGVFVIDLIVVFLFDRLIEKFRLLEEKHRLERQVDVQHESYRQTMRSFEQIKRIVHDTNKHLLYIRSCVERGESAEALHHLNATLAGIEQSHRRVATGHLVIDALVSHALAQAEHHRVRMTHDIRIGSSEIRLERYDLCVALGNALENALEAVRAVSSGEDRYIELYITSNDCTLAVRVVNSRPRNAGAGSGRTRKDPDWHGLGLGNIRAAAEKYGGYLRTEAGADRFETLIVLPYEKSGLHNKASAQG